jgi:hypothetical protein
VDPVTDIVANLIVHKFNPHSHLRLEDTVSWDPYATIVTRHIDYCGTRAVTEVIVSPTVVSAVVKHMSVVHSDVVMVPVVPVTNVACVATSSFWH